MQIIKLNAIDSTNTYLKNLSKKKLLADETVVVAETQTAGRGQMGQGWCSKPGQSLTFSVFKRFENLKVAHQFAIAISVSLGLKTALDNLGMPGISIKWPNDIMSRSQKVGGILIENQLEGGNVKASVIGIGLNVNETNFTDLPQATSLYLSTGNQLVLEEVLKTALNFVLLELKQLEKNDFQVLKTEYESHLFRKDAVSAFAENGTESFNGIIKGVTDKGKLIIETGENTLHQYGLKEIKMLF